ncbi:MAG: hypothetical protein ACI8W8_003070 [Rhodothermales bacterium]|jgi:hypothetical protein
MVPDAAYFLPGETARYCHRLDAAIWFGIPAGLIGWFCFQRFLRPALLELAPDPIRDRIWQLRTPQSNAAVPLCLLIGAGTHVLWDAATHAPGLSRSWQHLSTGLGSLLLATAAWRWLKRPPTAPSPARLCTPKQLIRVLAGISVCGSIAGIVTGFLFRANATVSLLGLPRFVVQGVKGAMVAAMLALLSLGRAAACPTRGPAPNLTFEPGALAYWPLCPCGVEGFFYAGRLSHSY